VSTEYSISMLSIEKCRDILKSHNYDLTNEEIKQVREFLYLFAEIQINAEKELLKDEECNTIL
jgi:tRNA A22 N-methylase